MGRARIGAVILAVLTAASACGSDDGLSGASGGPGSIVCAAVDEQGSPIGEMIVVDEAGVEQRRIAVDGLAGSTTGAGPWVLYRSITDGGSVFLDPTEGDTVSLPDVGGPSSRSRGGRYGIYQDPSGPSAFLVDFENGTATDLGFVLDAAGPSTVVLVDTDAAESLVLIWVSGTGHWVLPGDEPASGWFLGVGTVGGDLSPDGERVAYVAGGEPFTATAGDGSGLQAIEASGVRRTAFVGGDRLLLIGSEGVAVADPGGEVRGMWGEEELLGANVWVSRDGDAALVYAFADEDLLLHVDAANESVTMLDASGLQPLAATDRFLVLGAGGDVNPAYVDVAVTVSLRDGAVADLALPEGGVQRFFEASPDGSRAILSAPPDFFVADLETGGVDRLPIEVRHGIAFSPDGARIVVSAWDGGDPATVHLEIADADDLTGAEPLPTACVGPAWVASG